MYITEMYKKAPSYPNFQIFLRISPSSQFHISLFALVFPPRDLEFPKGKLSPKAHNFMGSSFQQKYHPTNQPPPTPSIACVKNSPVAAAQVVSQLSGKSNQRVGVHSAQSPRQAENDETGTPTTLLSVIVLRPSKGLLSFFNRHVLSYMLWRCLRVKRYCACARTLLPLSVSVLLSALSTEQICAS